ncbi:hypothetical protein SPRG_15303 [Saprolegnia parasitica CBS 223.65]|uniref:Ankyrin repeat protein n=1 Tax=Saprolegnia parasitica (strain CBS 223.65) TaxID=695850 RepID=A0A067BY32_SAPPC|nr:hypothetical protein SPRG_15303 [Saprolegnia parasitica CBS 223.65]KDO19497.1 hypothetical protein SPRG_15303 [Saprolegnia parasitica CBS 223.65]|eukprot:XP_012209800.1 hypothetical protein SPRG_15303 [Saprolegnia parasitica CBS 223.65]
MASFVDIFRASAPFAAIITSFQDGLYEDVAAYVATFRRHACEHPRSTKQRPLAHEATIYPSRLLPRASLLDMDCVDLFLHTGDIGRQAFAAPIHFAVAMGHVEIVLRALACRRLSVDLIACALANGHVDLAKHLLANMDSLDATRVPRSRTTTVEARVAARDAPELFLLLKAFAPKIDWVNALASAIQTRAASAAMYIYTQQGAAAVDATTMDTVCTMGLLALATQMHLDGQRCSANAMNGAAINGHLEMVMFLHEHRQEGCFPHTIARVAAQGHVDVLAYLVTHVVPHAARFYALAVDSASSFAALQILEAAVPGRVSLQTLASALESGSLDYVAHLLQTYHIVFRAALSARAGLVEWLFIKACGPHGSMALLQLLDDYCTSLSLVPSHTSTKKNAVHVALSFGHADMAAYLSTRGYHWRQSAFDDETKAAVCGHANAAASVAFLLQQRVAMDSDWANAACRYGSWLGVAECVVAAATSPVSMQWLLHAARGAATDRH